MLHSQRLRTMDHQMAEPLDLAAELPPGCRLGFSKANYTAIMTTVLYDTGVDGAYCYGVGEPAISRLTNGCLI